ncbi:MAG: hypothetical protein M3Z84_05775, partial [Actinomycetota bacterium]|nr:hypothetical protein [Actinomycetota bacterium]
LILVGRLLSEFGEAVHRWAGWAEEVVEAWPDDIRTAEPDRAALEAMADRTEAYAGRKARRPARADRRDAQTSF